MHNSLRVDGRAKRATALLTILGSAAVFAGCAAERDRTEATTVAARVHTEIKAGDFATVYNEAAPRFKSVGSELQFVDLMSQYRQKFGDLRNAKAIAYQSGLNSEIGRTHTMIFDLEYDHGRARETLILVRGQHGNMQLWKLGVQDLD